jgi:importin subunit alpha-1
MIPTVSLSNKQACQPIMKTLQTLMKMLTDPDTTKQLNALIQLRKLLSADQDFQKLLPMIDEIVNMGFLPILGSFLQRAENHTFQYEAAWVLTNIASGSSEHIEELMKTEAVHELVHWIDHPDDKVKDQCIWAVSNIAGDAPKHRDYVLALGALNQILKVVSETKQLSIVRNAAWAILNLCKGKPKPDYKVVSIAIPTLYKLLYYNDNEVVSDACSALCYLSDGLTSDKIEDFVSTGLVSKLLKLLL